MSNSWQETKAIQSAIHLTLLIWSRGRRGSSWSREDQIILFPQPLHPALPRDIVSLAFPGLSREPLTSGKCPTQSSGGSFWLSLLFIAMDWRRVCITAVASAIRLLIFRSIYPLLMNKTPRYLNSSTWGRICSPTQRRHSTFLGLRTMPLDLEALILIPIGSNQSSKRSQANEANRTTSSAKILRSPNRTPSTPWLQPRNSVHKSYEQSRWQREALVESILTGDKSYLLPAIRTRLWLRSYREWTSLHKKAYHPLNPREPPTGFPKGLGRMPSPDQQNTCGLIGQTPMHPWGPCWGGRAGPLFHVQDEYHIARPDSRFRLPAPICCLRRPWQYFWVCRVLQASSLNHLSQLTTRW